MSSFIIGLTGGIASGKTQASNYLASLGIAVVDADVVARQMVEPGSQCLTAISERYGPQILQADGALNRAKLREIIFGDAKEKQWLNNLLHPVIREETQRQLAIASSEYVILVAPLLIENELTKLVDKVLVIDVDEQTQLQRTCERDKVPLEQAKAILNAQISRQKRIEIADDIVLNDGSLTELENNLLTLHNSYLKLAKNKNNQ
jgi:dephospho-CoA kinase